MSDTTHRDGVPPVIAGRYRLRSKIAAGGMASVWHARDEVLGRPVAVKVLHAHLAADEGFRARLHREAVAAAKLTHPNIVSLYDTGVDGRFAWLVMELVDGPTLRAVMDMRAPLDLQEATSIGEKVARGLAYAHQRGLVHRDVKPANILIGDAGIVKVADFGIAKLEGAGTDLTGTGTVLGTAAYVAPEQIRGEDLDGACDQYSLGCVLFEAITGHRPFTGDSPVAVAAQRLENDPPPLRALRPDVPAPLEAAVRRALARRPRDRFPTTTHLADALAAFARPEGLPRARRGTVSAEPTTPLAPAGTPAPLAASDPPPHVAAERRRALPLIGVLVAASVALAAVAAGVAGEGSLFGFLDGGSIRTAEGDTVSVVPAAVSLFDPGGTGSEDESGLAALTDGDNSTGWMSVGYNTPDFGGLKRGLGFWLDLGGPHVLDSVALRTSTPGISYEVRVADEPPASLEGWRRIAELQDAPELAEVAADAPVVTRYVLIWVTGGLQPDGSGRHRAGFSELVVRGRPA